MRPAIVYSVKSTADPKGSIRTQTEDGYAVAAENDLTVVRAFAEERATGYHASRGDKLVQAMRLAEQLVAEHGSCALIVQHSDRFARGDVVNARHLLEYAIWALQAGVTLMSRQNPEAFMSLVITALYGDIAHGESRRKAVAVRDGQRRRAVRGDQCGARSFGYDYPGHGETIVQIPAEVAALRSMADDLLAGMGYQTIARRVHTSGVRTVRGGMWRGRSVRDLMTNPLYAGLVRYEGKLYAGAHEAVFDAGTWARIEEEVKRRSRVTGGGRGRAPAGRHLFIKGALRCGDCGQGMLPRTKDGREHYQCAGRREHGPEFCSMPKLTRVDVDRSVWNYFENVALDRDGTRRALAVSHATKIAEVEALLDSAALDAARADDNLARVKGDYVSGDITAAEWRELRADLEEAATAAAAEVERLSASAAGIRRTEAQIASQDEIVENLLAIRQAIVGALFGSRADIEAARASIGRVFEVFVLHRSTPKRVDLDLIIDADLWIDPIVRESAISGHDATGRPRPSRTPLVGAGTADATNNAPD